MQSDRHSNPKVAKSSCQWCTGDYQVGASRAADPRMFCNRRCEMEARFWLYEVLKKGPAE
jgi:hypothetical protein